VRFAAFSLKGLGKGLGDAQEEDAPNAPTMLNFTHL
jgi:hypothetical protein